MRLSNDAISRPVLVVETKNRSPKLSDAAVDPRLGRVLFGVTDLNTEAEPIRDGLFVSYTYGFSGPTGAHPIARASTPNRWNDEPVTLRLVSGGGAFALRTALDNLAVV